MKSNIKNTIIYIEHHCLGNPMDRENEIVCALIDTLKPILSKHEARIYRITRKQHQILNETSSER